MLDELANALDGAGMRWKPKKKGPGDSVQSEV